MNDERKPGYLEYSVWIDNQRLREEVAALKEINLEWRGADQNSKTIMRSQLDEIHTLQKEVAALKAALENIRKWINHFPHQMDNEDDVIYQYRSNAARIEKIINAALKGGDA